MSCGGSGGVLPVSIPPAGAGRTSERGISRRDVSDGERSLRYVPTKPPYSAAATLSGCRSVHTCKHMSTPIREAGWYTNHQAIVQHPSFRQTQLSNFIAQSNTSYNSSSRTSQSSSQRNGIYNMNICSGRKRSLSMTS